MMEREELLLYVLKTLRSVDEVVELGVAGGEHALLIYKILNPKKLYLIDAWGLDEAYGEHTGENVDDFYPALEKTRKIFEEKEAVQIIQGKTTTEYLKFEDHKFDFIYIDADHRYEPVKQDLTNWFPKLRIGGIIAGHDYNKQINNQYGVKQAVTEFIDNNKDTIKKITIFGRGGDILRGDAGWVIETKAAIGK